MQKKQQEFLKQRERLKYVTQNNNDKKIIDPDTMIKQLISDKETFKFNSESQSNFLLPKWLKLQNNLVPTVYEQIWHAVKLNNCSVPYCDTKIITELFTTSGLSLDKLGDLWSLVNITIPGFLTQQELYVMLALIALVQTGYTVKDKSILQDINHPILPQLDYTFLNITVANPAINRNVLGKSTSYDHKPKNSFHVSNTVPLQSQCSINYNSNWQQLPLNFNNNNSCQTNESDSLIDIPKTNLIADFGGLSLEKTISETIDNNIKLNTTNTVSKPPDLKNNYEFLNVLDMTTNIEPKSLDLPVFEDDDEFTEFQSAISVSAPDEYTDFQSAIPLPKYNFNNLRSDSNNLVLINTTNNSLPLCDVNQNSDKNNNGTSSYNSTDSCNEYRTLAESDKYDVFRSLMEQPATGKKVSNKEESESGSEYEEENVDEEFGEFFAATDPKQYTKENSKISVKEKCLQACLRLLQVGLRIFSNISNEQILKQVLSDEKGFRYYNQLKIVYDTSLRFQKKFECNDLNDSIQFTWEKLASYAKYVPSDELINDMSNEEELDGSVCKLCETKCDINCVRYAGNNYHVTCINLFLHFVEDSEISTMLNF